MNHQAIDATIATILKSDELNVKFDMHDFHHETSCGTFCCLAGFAVIAKLGVEEGLRKVAYIDTEAKDYLGLDADQADKLFYPGGDTDHIHYASPQDGIKVLEHLKATGEADWSIIDKINLDDYVGYVYKPIERKAFD